MTTRTMILLILGLIFASQAANLIKLGDASPFAISFWRLAIASFVLICINGNPFVSFQNKGKKALFLAATAGFLLAMHFFSWITSVQNTSVANAVLFFSLNPLFAAILESIFLKESVSRKELQSMLLAIVGVAVVGYHDFKFSYPQLYGDVMAVICAFFFAAYFLVGRLVLRRIRGIHYMMVVYMVAAVVSLLACLFDRVPIINYSLENWICFFSLAIIPTILGHTFMNLSLKEIKTSTLSMLTLTEPILATIGALVFYNEAIHPISIIGFALITISSIMVILTQKNNSRRPT